jgi:RimJ/RimL family protein N-acetyltransferase
MILETERLKVRQFKEEDFPNYSKLDSNPEVMRYIGAPRNQQQMTDRLTEIMEYYERFPQFGVWALTDSHDDSFHGWVCLKHLDSTEEIELGYRLMHSSWGKGLATEASMGLLNYGFSKLNLGRIVAVTVNDNKPSQNVLKKIGMKYEKMAYFYSTNVLYFGLNRSDNLDDSGEF